MTFPRRLRSPWSSRITRALPGAPSSILDVDQHHKDLLRAGRMWRATSPAAREDVRSSFARAFARMTPEERADIAEFTNEILIAARGGTSS